jgi:hypothetical protein
MIFTPGRSVIPVISLFFILTGLSAWYGCSLKPLLFPGPSKPKQAVPVTYHLGWWSNQNELQVDSFGVSVIESKLNVLNTKSLIAYRIKGHLTYTGHWKPYIKEVQISERFLTDTIHKAEAEIRITPLVNTKEDNSVNGGVETFDFTNEYVVSTFHWGDNKIRFRCMNHETVLELHQKK